MPKDPRNRAVLAVALALWLTIAPGCSWCRAVGRYYSSDDWIEDLETAAGVVGAVAFAAVAIAGLIFLLDNQDPGSKSRVASSLGHSGRTSGAHSSSYTWRDYYRTMSR